ncbi:MAG: hypothetical protein ACKO9Q_18805 [Pirellula sp.]
MPKDDTPNPKASDSPVAQTQHTARRVPTEWDRLISSRKVILLVLFCVTGALGLPLLWFSPAFSTRAKVVWSICNILYTLALIALCIGICIWSYQQIVNSI